MKTMFRKGPTLGIGWRSDNLGPMPVGGSIFCVAGVYIAIFVLQGDDIVNAQRGPKHLSDFSPSALHPFFYNST
jgi:hypothetical protein